jgi:hypothetical protein
MILILGKNICQYMQGSALHKHRTFRIAIFLCMNTLDHREILLTCFLQSRMDAKNPWQFPIRIPLVKADVALPDRKHAKLWSGMRHEEYADEAQSMPITTNLLSSNPVHGEMYSIQHYVIKFVSVLRQVGGFLQVLRFPPPIKLTATI